MCVTISNVTVVAQLSSSRLIHASINNLSLDGSILPRSQIALCVLVDAFSCRLLQTVPNSGNNTRDESLGTNSSWQPCLSEFSVGFQTEIHVDSVKPIIQKLNLNVTSPKVMINERLLVRKTSQEPKNSNNLRLQLAALSPFLPRVRTQF